MGKLSDELAAEVTEAAALEAAVTQAQTATATVQAAFDAYKLAHPDAPAPPSPTPVPNITAVRLSADANGQRIDFDTDTAVKTYGHATWTSGVQDPTKRTFDLTYLAANVDIPVKVTWLDGSTLTRTVRTGGAPVTTPPVVTPPATGQLNARPARLLHDSMGLDFHPTYPAYLNTLDASTAKLKEVTNIIRLDFPGRVTNPNGTTDEVGTRMWQWIVANGLKVVYISEGTKFPGWSSHAVNRQILESVPGAKSCVWGIEATNEEDTVFRDDFARWQAEVNGFCTAWSGYDLIAPSVADWRNPHWYGAFPADKRFKYGNTHSYTGPALSPSPDQLDLAIANLRVIVPIGDWITGECGHGAYQGGIGPDGTTGPNLGNPPVSEAQKAISNVLEIVERHRRGSVLTCLYEAKNQSGSADPKSYETTLGQWALDNSDLPAFVALRNLSRLYSGPDPVALTPLGVTVSGGDGNTRYDLHQDATKWLLSVYQLGNNPPPVSVSLAFDVNRAVIKHSIIDGATSTLGSSRTTVITSSSALTVLEIS